jgi:hypothetical protein
MGYLVLNILLCLTYKYHLIHTLSDYYKVMVIIMKVQEIGSLYFGFGVLDFQSWITIFIGLSYKCITL